MSAPHTPHTGIPQVDAVLENIELPWELGSLDDGEPVAGVAIIEDVTKLSPDEARYIVIAANTFPTLVAALWRYANGWGEAHDAREALHAVHEQIVGTRRE